MGVWVGVDVGSTEAVAVAGRVFVAAAVGMVGVAAGDVVAYPPHETSIITTTLIARIDILDDMSSLGGVLCGIRV
jgi:hypothetical protein